MHLSYVDTEASNVLLGIDIDANEETEDHRSLKPVSMQKYKLRLKHVAVKQIHLLHPPLLQTLQMIIRSLMLLFIICQAQIKHIKIIRYNHPNKQRLEAKSP